MRSSIRNECMYKILGDTLAYLEENLNATQTARELYIHRSTLLYRLERIREILDSDLTDPDELLYLNFSFRLLEQEEQKDTGS